MLQVIGIAACIAIFLFLVTSAAALTWTGICMIAGGGIGCIATFLYFERRMEKRERQREWDREAELQRRDEERENEYRRMLVLFHAAQKAGGIPTLEIPKQKVQRLGKR